MVESYLKVSSFLITKTEVGENSNDRPKQSRLTIIERTAGRTPAAGKLTDKLNK